VDAPDTREDESPLLPWVLSAPSPEELGRRAEAIKTEVSDGTTPADLVARSLAAELAPLPHRAVVFGRTRADLLDGLDAVAQGTDNPGTLVGRALDPARVAFVFSPLGCEYPGMGLDLLEANDTFRAWIGAYGVALSRVLDWSLEDLLHDRAGAPPLGRLDVRQPALFAVSASLAELWRSFGVDPDAVIGHSVGEIAAAASGRALTPADAARVAATWGRSSARLEGTGAMASVPLAAEKVEARLRRSRRRLWISGVNSPSRTAVSGDAKAVKGLLEELALEGVHGRSMGIPGPGHSPGMAPIDAQFMQELSDISPREGSATFYSAATGEPIRSTNLDAGYWSRNLRQPVLFEAAVRSLLDDGYSIFIEVGPNPVLVDALEEILAERGVGFATGTLDEDDPGYLLLSLARAFVNGAEVDWRAVCRDLPLLPPTFRRPPTPESVREDSALLAERRSQLVSMTEAAQEGAMRELVGHQLAALLGDEMPVVLEETRAFRDLGLDSPAALRLRDRLGHETGIALAKTAIFDHPTVEALARHLRLMILGRDQVPSADPKPGEAEEGALQRIDEMDIEALVELSRKSS
jgi:acyl transferase domain-containing protein